jgi:hypothetical protein
MAPSDICALDDGARRLHVRQSAALAIQAVDPKAADRLLSRLISSLAAQQPIDDNRLSPRSVSFIKGGTWLAKIHAGLQI